MATMKSSGGKIGGGKSAGKSPVRSGGSVGKAPVKKEQVRQAQRTVAPAKGYGQSATGRNATAERRAVSNSVKNAANKAALTERYAKAMTQGATGGVGKALNMTQKSTPRRTNFSAEANATQSMAKKKRSY